MIKCYLYLRAVFKKDDVLINQRAVWEMHMIRAIALEAPLSNAWSTQNPSDTVSLKASPYCTLPLNTHLIPSHCPDLLWVSLPPCLPRLQTF